MQLQALIEILGVVMVLLALGIVSVGAIQGMVRLYRIQSLVLAAITGLVALEQGEATLITRVFLVAFAILIPVMLAYAIESMLAQATVLTRMPWLARLGPPFLRAISPRYREEAARSIREALPVWLEHGLSPRRQRTSAAASLLLTAVAYVVALNLLGEQPDRARELAVSMTLLMLGIFTMINREDLISQIMGLLVMDHGLFLAAVRVIDLPALISWFVVSLFLYILITLVILVVLLPELRNLADSIEVADQKELKG